MIPLLCLALATLTAADAPSFVRNGFVPDAATAQAIAEAVLIPVYGRDQILSERPFHATLSNGVWTVTGTVPCAPPGPCAGGAAEVRISKRTGQILYMIHSK